MRRSAARGGLRSHGGVGCQEPGVKCGRGGFHCTDGGGLGAVDVEARMSCRSDPLLGARYARCAQLDRLDSTRLDSTRHRPTAPRTPHHTTPHHTNQRIFYLTRNNVLDYTLLLYTRRANAARGAYARGTASSPPRAATARTRRRLLRGGPPPPTPLNRRED